MMRIVNRPRRGGKTTEMIHMAAEHGLCIVCPNAQQALWIKRAAQRMNKTIPEPITWEQFTAGAARGISQDYVIDNLDLCLQRYAGANGIRGASLTGAEVA